MIDDTYWWLPPNFSEEGARIDDLWNVLTWIVGSIFVVVQGALIWACIKYRSRRGERKARHITGNRRLEVIWTVIPTVILLYIIVVSQDLWAALRTEPPEPEDRGATIWIEGERFAWRAHYPGEDGVFGNEDDFEGGLNYIPIPVGKPVLLQLTSKDVIHSFSVPWLRLKMDCVPGLTTELWFTPTKTTEPGKVLDVLCAELCGDGHFEMRGRMPVFSEEDYRDWVKQKSAEAREGE